MPSGRPLAPVPAGRVTTRRGRPRVQIELKRGSPVYSTPAGASPGALGQSKASTLSNSESTWVRKATDLALGRNVALQADLEAALHRAFHQLLAHLARVAQPLVGVIAGAFQAEMAP